ncbi:hypothetical protein MRX96_001185 [Rhipicephalus microplus]
MKADKKLSTPNTRADKTTARVHVRSSTSVTGRRTDFSTTGQDSLSSPGELRSRLASGTLITRPRSEPTVMEAGFMKKRRSSIIALRR